MTNELIVSRIKQGDNALLTALWEQNKRLIYQYTYRYYYAKERLCKSASVRLDDLLQEGYLGMLDMVQAYDESKGFKFTTYMGYRLLNRYNTVSGIRGNKVLFTKSLDEPVGNDEDGDTLLIDTVADERITNMDDIAQMSNTKQILLAEIYKLEQVLQDVVMLYYFKGLSVAQISEVLLLTKSQAFAYKEKALKQLRGSRAIRQLHSSYNMPRNSFYMLPESICIYNSSSNHLV